MLPQGDRAGGKLATHCLNEKLVSDVVGANENAFIIGRKPLTFCQASL